MFKICKPVLLFLIALSLCKAEFAPNSDAGMVSISMDGESLQNLLSIYENAGYHDFGTTDMLENTKEVKSVNKYYFYNFKMDLSDDDLGFSMDGTLDANARKNFWVYLFT